MMADAETFRRIALSLPGAIEDAHFENQAFKVNKKIFATLNALLNRGMVKLSVAEQDLFCTFDKTVIFPVPNKWGKGGSTYVDLQKVSVEMLTDLLKTAYRTVAPKKLADLVTFAE